MITSTEARQRAENCSVVVAQICELLGKRIEQAADNGLRYYICNGSDTDGLSINAEIFSSPSPKPVIKAVMIELKKHGYQATWAKNGDPYIPRAYEDDVPPPKFQTWAVGIRW